MNSSVIDKYRAACIFQIGDLEKIMLWLEDDEIYQILSSGSASEIIQAIEVACIRLMGGETLCIPPVKAIMLKPFSGTVPSNTLWDFVGFVLGREGFPSFERHSGLAEIAEIVTDYVDASGSFHVALRLKIGDQSVEDISQVIRYIGERLNQADERPSGDIQFFLSCLLDGKEAVRSAVIKGLLEWTRTPLTVSIIENARAEYAGQLYTH